MMSDHSPTATIVEPRELGAASIAKPQPRFHVILLDDDDHTYDYVIEMMMKLFRIGKQDAFLRAQQIDSRGRGICDTTTLERAEFKRDQIHAYGADWRIEDCRGSMSSLIEPAPD